MGAALSPEGRMKCCTVLCLHVTWLVWTGLAKGLGVMLPVFQREFVSKAWLVGWVIGLITGVCDLVGPLAGPQEAKFGTRVVVMASGALIGASLIVGSVTTTVVQLALSLTLMQGPGLGLANILSRAMVGRSFTTWFAAANAIGQAGHSFGLILFAPLTQLFLDTYGWRGAMLLLGGISMHLVVCGALLTNGPTTPGGNTRQTDDYEPLPRQQELDDDSVEAAVNGDAPELRCCSPALHVVCHSQFQAFGLEIFSKLSFWLAAVIFVCQRTVNSLWVVYFVGHAQAKGFSGQDAVTFSAAAGVGNLVFKLAHGPVVDRDWISLRAMIAGLIVVAAACLFIDPWMNYFWLMLVNAFFYMGASGGICSLLDVYIKGLLGADLLVNAFGWMGALSVLFTNGIAFLPGWIYDESGSYDLAFIVMGGIWSVSLVVMCVKILLQRYGWITRAKELRS